MLSATHSGPGGHSHYGLYNLTILGHDKQDYDTIVNGIFQSIVRAHNTMTPGRIKFADGDLLNASFNRSRPAYDKNPAVERALYQHDTDKTMTLLRFEDENGNELGMLNWFAVHATNYRGQAAKTVFWGAHPKNNLKTQASYLAIQRYTGGSWQTVYTDADPETRYHWKRKALRICT